MERPRGLNPLGERDREQRHQRRHSSSSHHNHHHHGAPSGTKRPRETAAFSEAIHKAEIIDPDTDTILRYFGCLLMRKAAGLLRLPARTACTAQYFFHHFYHVHALHKIDLTLMAQSCLYLACKAEETLRKVRDVINTFYFLVKPQQPMLKIGKRYWDLRDEVVAGEQILLRTLNFNLTFTHPHKFLLNYANSMNGSQALVQVAWNFANDLYYMPICMQRDHQPNVLACSTLYLAQFVLGKSNMEVPQVMSFPWWEVFGAKKQDMEDVSNNLLETLQTLRSIPFDSALMVYQEYTEKYSPPTPLRASKGIPP